MYSTPVHTADESAGRQRFLALMWSLSYPGRIYPLLVAVFDGQSERNAMAKAVSALLDIETTYFSDDTDLSAQLPKSGARRAPVESADYVCIPALLERHLAQLDRMRVGTASHPDASATLFIGADFDAPDTTLRLSGPGVSCARSITIGGIPRAFWTWRQSMLRYPLGFDAFLVGQGRVMGLPRTTRVTACT